METRWKQRHHHNNNNGVIAGHPIQPKVTECKSNPWSDDNNDDDGDRQCPTTTWYENENRGQGRTPFSLAHRWVGGRYMQVCVSVFDSGCVLDVIREKIYYMLSGWRTSELAT